MKKIHRFTLVELLAVMAIIAILSGLGFGAYTFANTRAKESATESLLKQIEAGLESFHTKNGYYPRSAAGGFSAITFTVDSANNRVTGVDFGDAATKLTYNSTASNRKARMENEKIESFTKALDLEAIRKHLNNSRELEDAWGEKIYYRSPGTFKSGGYDLISAGPDGEFSKENKDASDAPGVLNSLSRDNFRQDDGTRLCDDIFNF